jgi:hypothetical protein
MGVTRSSLTARRLPFLVYRWPRVHDLLVEECLPLMVSDIIAGLPYPARRHLERWRSPTYGLTLVARQAGRARRWSVLCPACLSRRHALYRPPDHRDAPWRCRACLDGVGAIYASQRFGRRHPLRRLLTPRKRVIAQRQARALQRSRERLIPDLRGKLPAVPPPFEPVRERFLGALAGSLMDGPITAESRDRLIEGTASAIRGLMTLAGGTR